MKKKLRSELIVCVLLIYSIFSPTLKAQPLDSTTVSRLYYTAKVWGYLKYFHSEVAKGVINWDSVLIQTIPQITSSTTDQEFKDALMIMIQKAGPMANSNVSLPPVPDSLKYNLNLSWIEDGALSGVVHDSLIAVKTRFGPQNNFYVTRTGPWPGANPSFETDKNYNNTGFPSNATIRLLGLFRYWNVIQYFYPHKKIIDNNWEDVLKEFIPIMIDANDPLVYQRSVMLMQTRINDSHAFTPVDSRLDSIYIIAGYYLPFWLKQIGSETVVFKSLDTSLVKPGDIIRQIDGISIDTIRNQIRQYREGSNSAAIERNVNNRITRGEQNEQVVLKLENTNGLRDVNMTKNISSTNWRAMVFNSGPTWEKISLQNSSKVIGYVNMEKLREADLASMFAEFEKTNAIVFDLRNYPDFATVKTLCRYLFPGQVSNGAYTSPNIQYPGTFEWFNNYVGGSPLKTPYSRKIMVLCEEETQSLSEFTIMALQNHPGSKVIGSQTAGADGDISRVYWPGGVSTYYTGLGWFYPDHRPTQRVGIVPDIEVHPTIEGIRQGKDEVLEAAINYWLSTADTTAPQVTVGALASPVVNVVRWGIGADEIMGSVSLKVNGSVVNLQQQGEIYFGNYTLTDTNNLSVEVSATDANLNQASMTRNYQVATLSKGVTHKSYSIMGKGEGYLLTSQISNVDLPVGWTLLGQPLEVITTGSGGNVVLKAGYEAGGLDQSKIGVYRYESGNWHYLGGEGKEGHIESNIQKGTVAVLYNPDHKSVPKEFALENNYPNPFNPTTTIRYAVPAGSKVTLRVYNILGQEVRSLVNGFRDVGRYEVMWDGRNNGGNQVSSGVYLYRMEAGKFIQTKKMLFVK